MNYNPDMSVASHIEKIQMMMDARMRREVDVRAWEIATAKTQYPLQMIPLQCAVVGNQLSLKLHGMICRQNSDQFDHLTEKGYRLNFLTGEYQPRRNQNEYGR